MPVSCHSRWAKADNFLPISVLAGGIRAQRLYSFHVDQIQVRYMQSREHAVLTHSARYTAALTESSYNHAIDTDTVNLADYAQTLLRN
ncbi:hypothetical protein SAMN05445850_4046 [Paraburkholderia tuberum]|uniref:Uncharacterized protein n=1 Tax=Paraburkholderia tuberum TaxID=157910 RepID=A0A1H1J2H5_9BURK|nr:hypothetical protein SAMN05445850_4046 [Paraburkholderia tuberum]